jgi:hypothetical protein
MSASLTRDYSLQKLKLQKGESHSNSTFLKKELEDGYWQALFSGSSSVVSSSNLAPDPLLSFLCNVPPAEKNESAQPSLSSKVTVEEKNSDVKLLERLGVWLCFMTSFTFVLMFVPIYMFCWEKKKFKGLVLGRVSEKKKKQYNRWQMVERIYKVSLYSEAKVWKRNPKHFNVTSANY